jgi:hypothetical protein
MTHGQIHEYPAGSSVQRCNHPAQKAWFACRSGKGIGRSIRHIQTPSLSLRERSPGHGPTDSDTRRQDFLYREALHKTNPSITAICSDQRTDHKRSCLTGLRNLSLQRSEAWTSRGTSIARLSSNTALTDSHHGKSAKPINVLCLTRRGAQPVLMIL